MSKRNGHPERSSRFICLRCLSENKVGAGIPRTNTKEKDHIKNLLCLCTNLNERTKNLEVRWCDDMNERMNKAIHIRSNYYDEDGNLLSIWEENNKVER